jgi:hypothetical protein
VKIWQDVVQMLRKTERVILHNFGVGDCEGVVEDVV